MAHRIEGDVSQGGGGVLELLTFEAALPEPPGAIVFATGAARDLSEQALPEGLGTRSKPGRNMLCTPGRPARRVRRLTGPRRCPIDRGIPSRSLDCAFRQVLSTDPFSVSVLSTDPFSVSAQRHPDQSRRYFPPARLSVLSRVVD